MSAASQINAEVKEQVLALYSEGHKIADITKATGTPRATIYWLLERSGVRPNRLGRSSEVISASEILDKLVVAEQDLGRLRQRLDHVESQLHEEQLLRRAAEAQMTEMREFVAAVRGVPPQAAPRKRTPK